MDNFYGYYIETLNNETSDDGRFITIKPEIVENVISEIEPVVVDAVQTTQQATAQAAAIMAEQSEQIYNDVAKAIPVQKPAEIPVFAIIIGLVLTILIVRNV